MVKNTTILWVAGILAVVLIFNPGGIVDKATGMFAAEEAPTITAQGECLSVEDTTLTISAAEVKFAPTTKLSTEWHRLLVEGVDQGLSQDGATETLNPGDNIELYWAENSTEYYAAKQAFALPCKGAIKAGVMPDSNAFQIYQNGTGFTFRVTNEDDNLVNSNTNDQTLGAGDVKTLPFTVIGQYERALSPYGKICAVFEGNSTVYDDIVLGDFPDGCEPGLHTTGNAVYKTWSYELPALISNSEINTNLVIDVDDTNNPANGEDINITWYDQDWYQNTDTGVMEFGYENDQDAEVGMNPVIDTIYVS